MALSHGISPTQPLPFDIGVPDTPAGALAVPFSLVLRPAILGALDATGIAAVGRLSAQSYSLTTLWPKREAARKAADKTAFASLAASLTAPGALEGWTVVHRPVTVPPPSQARNWVAVLATPQSSSDLD